MSCTIGRAVRANQEHYRVSLRGLPYRIGERVPCSPLLLRFDLQWLGESVSIRRGCVSVEGDIEDRRSWRGTFVTCRDRLPFNVTNGTAGGHGVVVQVKDPSSPYPRSWPRTITGGIPSSVPRVTTTCFPRSDFGSLTIRTRRPAPVSKAGRDNLALGSRPSVEGASPCRAHRRRRTCQSCLLQGVVIAVLAQLGVAAGVLRYPVAAGERPVEAQDQAMGAERVRRSGHGRRVVDAHVPGDRERQAGGPFVPPLLVRPIGRTVSVDTVTPTRAARRAAARFGC